MTRLPPLVAIALATLVVATGAVAALPADAAGNGLDAQNHARDDDAGGPPVDMPENVPDHVSEIHSSILDFLSGAIDGLGEAVSDVTPGNDASDPADAGG